MASLHTLHVEVNGQAQLRSVQPRQHLVDFIRNELGLKGSHLGCEHGVCGACTVEVDGRIVRGCLVLAAQVDGRRVETVETPTPSKTPRTDSQWNLHDHGMTYVPIEFARQLERESANAAEKIAALVRSLNHKDATIAELRETLAVADIVLCAIRDGYVSFEYDIAEVCNGIRAVLAYQRVDSLAGANGFLDLAWGDGLRGCRGSATTAHLAAHDIVDRHEEFLTLW